MDATKELYSQIVDLATNPTHTKWLSPALIGLDALLCGLIIQRVPYTEIDWEAYMEQVQQFVGGERRYPNIYGGTGPLVYPAAHVYTYAALYKVTENGNNILLAQWIFAVVYLSTLSLVMACYRRAKVPPYVFPMLVLSKRLHSIFVLRCFNDCFAVLFLWIAIYAFQRRMWTLGSMAYSWGVGTKMILLLAGPAFYVILFLAGGVMTVVNQTAMMLQLQVLIAFPFIMKDLSGYLSRSFDFGRKFLYEWTVNWRFVPEDVFLSKDFSNSLLVGHVGVLALFGLTRWLKPADRSILSMIKSILQIKEPLGDIQQRVNRRLSPNFIMTTVLTSMAIGLLFARSLHYQFYAYLAWSTPFLLWKSGLPPVLQFGLWAAQEWAWNVFPSSETSSQVAVGVMAITVIGVWFSTAAEIYPEKKDERSPTDRWYIK